MTIGIFMDVWLGLFGGLSIMLVSLDRRFAGAVCGLLSEIGFVYASWVSGLWSLWLLTAWWTVWWGVIAWRNWP